MATEHTSDGALVQVTERSPLLGESGAASLSVPQASSGNAADEVGGHDGVVYKVYASRYLILLFFTAMALHQSQIWITYGTIANETMAYYDVSSTQIDILAAYGPIAFFPSMALTSWLLEKYGLRLTVLCGALLEVVGSGLRVFGVWRGGFFAFIHIGQFLNGLCGPMMAAPPAMISERWFPPKHRATATAVGATGGAIGGAFAFLLIPYLVRFHGMQEMLVVQFGISAAIFLAILAYFPEHPPSPSSASSSAPRAKLMASWREVRTNKAFWLLSLAGGISSGMFNGWTSVLSLILNSTEGFTESTLWKDFFRSSSWIGFASCLLAIVACVFAAGPVADRFPRRLKMLILVPFSIATLLYLVFAMSVQGYIPHAGSWTKFFTAVIASSALAAANPLFYEALAEATYPVPEAISVMMMLGINNIACLLFEVIGLCGLIQDASHANILNWLMMVAMGMCWVMTLLYKEDYKRLDLDRNAE